MTTFWISPLVDWDVIRVRMHMKATKFRLRRVDRLVETGRRREAMRTMQAISNDLDRWRPTGPATLESPGLDRPGLSRSPSPAAEPPPSPETRDAARTRPRRRATPDRNSMLRSRGGNSLLTAGRPWQPQRPLPAGTQPWRRLQTCAATP